MPHTSIGYAIQRQSSGGMLQKRCTQKICKIHKKTSKPAFILKKLQAWACNFTKKRLRRRSFSANFAKFFRAPFLQNTSYDYTAQKLKFYMKNFLSKCDQIHSFLRIWSHLLKESLVENFIFCGVWLKPETALETWEHFCKGFNKIKRTEY